VTVSFVSFGILEHFRPYKSEQTQRFARLAEFNLFATLSFVLLLEIDLDGEALSYAFYDLALVTCTVATSSIPIVIAILASLGRVYKLWADSDPSVKTGDAVEIIDAGPADIKCLHCIGKVVSDMPSECTYETIVTVEVTPKVNSVVAHTKCATCYHHPVVAFRACKRCFGCTCAKGKCAVGQLQIGQVGVRVKKPVQLILERSQIRKIVDKKKIMLELCKVCVHSVRLAREVTEEPESVMGQAEKKVEGMHNSATGPGGEISNAQLAAALVTQLKPVLEPLLAARGLLWDPVLPYLKKVRVPPCFFLRHSCKLFPI
jgi:hypothetical protein